MFWLIIELLLALLLDFLYIYHDVYKHECSLYCIVSQHYLEGRMKPPVVRFVASLYWHSLCMFANTLFIYLYVYTIAY